MVEAVQLKPSKAEDVALAFERLAADARAGNIIGYSIILLRPGDQWTAIGFQAGNALQEIGAHFLAIMDIKAAITNE